MGVGSEKADTGNYVAYLADQIAKKANVYDNYRSGCNGRSGSDADQSKRYCK